MASGLVSGFQHQLIDEENLTKERFVELCDQWFYHLGRYEMETLEELEAHRQKEIQSYKEKIEEAKTRLTVLSESDIDELQEEYEEYVETAHKANATYRAKHEREMERLALIREYAEAFRPHLEYIWKDLKDPKLFQVEVFSFGEWRVSQAKTAQHTIEFYSELVAKAGAIDDKASEAGRVVDDFERRKAAFLATE